MSRRRGEFEHRTSIFEGAYRAWSHLGGIPPADLASKSPSDLDPLIYQLTQDPRLLDSTPPSTTSGAPAQDPPQPQASPPAPSQDLVLSAQPDATSSAPPSANIDGNTATVDERLYPYEPLPRSGLAHPFVQAIISPWLGPNAEHDDTQIGLTTLRTWWQHRRKGESTSAKSALGTEKMRSVVDGYTRHFFNLAFCLVMHDGEQPPRTLAKKIKEMEKEGVKFPPLKKDSRMGSEGVGTMGSFSAIAALSGVTSQGGGSRGRREETGSNKRHLGIEGAVPEYSCCSSSVLDMGSHHNGAGGPVNFRTGGGSYVGNGSMRDGNVASNGSIVDSGGAASNSYGDPTKTPVVFVSEAGDIQIAMSVSGMTCGNCVKIIETVLKGVNGQPSPIQGILDAAADRELSMVIIKIEKSSFAKRIAYEARESLRMVGYDAEAKEMVIIDPKSGSKMDLGVLRTAFDIVAATDSRDVFDWSLSCTCPDNGVIRNDCLRHSQMNKRIFEAFDQRQEQVKEFMGGCGRRYGLACSCGANCQCKSGSCCGPIADATVENRNAVIHHDGTASENGARIRQASHSFSPIARNYYRNILDASSMGQMPPGNINIPLMPRNMMHTSANQFFDPNVQATMIQSQMPMRVRTTPIRTGNSSAIAVERMDLGERMDRNLASTHQQHLMSEYMRNMNNTNDNFGGYTWKPESVDNQSSNTVNHSIFWNPP